jgi:hypothetical protein
MKSWKKSGLMHRNQLTLFTFSEDFDSFDAHCMFEADLVRYLRFLCGTRCPQNS